MLEVVVFEPDGGGSWIVASGFGPRAVWYRNLRAEPKTLIEVDHGTASQGRPPPVRIHGHTVDRTDAGFGQAGSATLFVRLKAGPGSRLR